ncbi:TPA: hypothetical protein N0F65_009745 [Lagenidium giganteum]|uniref:C2H2-type domain-containing protein n=1 Tax=Lagenidium giganteum TaxID=4803 RepID=A0AAV2YR33_9STRA|nr:TPA: hypothetical protein N0F65_009745 [Lagenidium giganteum]
MGKKKRKDDGAVAPKRNIFCYYCDRVFDDEKVLIQHQKARHFKCHVCHKKLSTAGGMVVHIMQVHKETLTAVPNAKEGRESVDIEIYGMEGVPGEDGAHMSSDMYKKPRLDGGMMMPGFAPRGGMPPGFPRGPPPPPPPHIPVPGMVGMPPRPPLGLPGAVPGMPAIPGMPPRPFPPRPFPGGPPPPAAMGIPGFPPQIPGMPPRMIPGAPPMQPPFGVPPPWAGAVPSDPTAAVPGTAPAAVAAPGATPVLASSGPASAVSSNGASSEAATPIADFPSSKSTNGLVYGDEGVDVSMEERRALRPKYGYNPKVTSVN